MAPIRVPLYKNWSGGFCNYLFQTERVPRNTRRFLRCKSCIFLFKTELVEFAILQTILKTPLSLNCTMALDQSTKGPLLNFPKYYKHKNKSGNAESKSKASKKENIASHYTAQKGTKTLYSHTAKFKLKKFRLLKKNKKIKKSKITVCLFFCTTHFQRLLGCWGFCPSRGLVIFM